jgi:ParB-like chromosome segregation protein Spo0J
VICATGFLPTTITARSIERPIPRPSDPRTHTREQVAGIAASICEFRFTNAILVDADGDIITGHARLLAAEKLGVKEVP